MAGERIGRYLIFDEIAAGGMATVHLGRLVGDVGFSRTVAVKRLHPQFAKDPDFVSMFLDEARLAARVSHPNVVQTLDVVAQDGALVLVMEYVRGESLATLLRSCRLSNSRPPPEVALAIACGALHGLHAAHEATDASGKPIGLVHRDVSPHNVLVGTDGVARMLDFGIAKAVNQLHTTREGQLKGKLAYMAPEQLEGAEATRRSDVYAAAIVLWEALSAKRCFEGDTPGAIIGQIRAGVAKPSTLADVSAEIDAIVARGTAFDPKDRYASAREMALDLEKATLATASKVGAWVTELAATTLQSRAQCIAALEGGDATRHDVPSSRPRAAIVVEGPMTGSMPAPTPAVSEIPPEEIPPRQGSRSASRAEVMEPRAAARRRRAAERRLLLGGGALVIALLAGVIAFAWPKSAPTPSVANVPPAPSSVIAVETPPSMVSTAPPLDPPPATSTPPPFHARVPVSATTAHPVTSASRCNPPFSLGPNGIRIPKAECY